LARTVGWVAHWNEMIADPRPASFARASSTTGPAERPLVPLAERATRRATRRLTGRRANYPASDSKFVPAGSHPNAARFNQCLYFTV